METLRKRLLTLLSSRDSTNARPSAVASPKPVMLRSIDPLFFLALAGVDTLTRYFFDSSAGCPGAVALPVAAGAGGVASGLGAGALPAAGTEGAALGAG